jgi:hypothetical protein
MKRNLLLPLFAAIFSLSACHKPGNNGNGSSSGTVSPGQGTVTLHWLYDIKDWIKDTDTEHNYPPAPHFYSNKTNVKYVFTSNHDYTFNYVALPSNAATTEYGTWSYDENTRILTLTPSSGSSYTYRVTALRDEHMTWGYTYTTYDNEGVPNGTAEELVYLYGEK